MSNEVKQYVIENENVKQYILGGKSKFTLTNVSTNNHLTLKITKVKDFREQNAFTNGYYVSVCTDYLEFNYIGLLLSRNDEFFKFIPKKSFKDMNGKSVATVQYIIKNFLNDFKTHPDMKFYHFGCCCRCGRTITHPQSIERGIGPDCQRMM